jgi:hypothetical protein
MVETKFEDEIKRFVSMVLREGNPMNIHKALGAYRNEDDLNSLVMAAFNFGKPRDITKKGDEEAERVVREIIMPILLDRLGLYYRGSSL